MNPTYPFVKGQSEIQETGHFENMGLERSCVHLWKYAINHEPVDTFRATAILSPTELTRINRLALKDDREKLTRIRICLRNILSHYTHLPPQCIQFVRGPHQKPMIKADHSQPPVYFNVSYRKDYALIGISNNAVLGIDIEEVKPIPLTPFINHYFSVAEQQKIMATRKKESRLALLYTFWAMKEALLKALTIGLNASLKDYDLSEFLQRPFHFPEFDKENRWFIRNMSVSKSYKAALAVRSPQVNLQVLDYAQVAGNNYSNL
jgi:4'-phosphopantetheinyl transferase